MTRRQLRQLRASAARAAPDAARPRRATRGPGDAAAPAGVRTPRAAPGRARRPAALRATRPSPAQRWRTRRPSRRPGWRHRCSGPAPRTRKRPAPRGPARSRSPEHASRSGHPAGPAPAEAAGSGRASLPPRQREVRRPTPSRSAHQPPRAGWPATAARPAPPAAGSRRPAPAHPRQLPRPAAGREPQTAPHSSTTPAHDQDRLTALITRLSPVHHARSRLQSRAPPIPARHSLHAHGDAAPGTWRAAPRARPTCQLRRLP